MSVRQFFAEFAMGISGAHPEPKSVILAMLAEDARSARAEDGIRPRPAR